MKNKKAYPRKETPSWVSDWLKHQVENYLRENADHFDRNGTRLWAMTEEQVIELCRIIYVAKAGHSGNLFSGNHNYGRRKGKHGPGSEEGDGSYLDRAIAPELRGLTK